LPCLCHCSLLRTLYGAARKLALHLHGRAASRSDAAGLLLLRSIWTIDLAHLLRRFGMEVVFCTITLGANPAFSSEAFYAENMPEDEARVQRLFNVRGCCIPGAGSLAYYFTMISGRKVSLCVGICMSASVKPVRLHSGGGMTRLV
jgi:Guanylylate cyclase